MKRLSLSLLVCAAMLAFVAVTNARAGDNIPILPVGGEVVLHPAGPAGDGEIPRKVTLGQNVPNPFTTLTSISYGIPSRTYVRMVVYTMVGNPIALLVNGWQNAGSYTVDFTALDLPPGLYYYQIQTDLGTLTRRMTVSR